MIREVADQEACIGIVTRGQLGISIEDHPASMPAAAQATIPAGAMVVADRNQSTFG
jgi:hypothetical protein